MLKHYSNNCRKDYKMRRNGLTKYDAPLRIQFEWGQEAFKKGKVTCPIDPNTMQAREWQRGWDNA